MAPTPPFPAVDPESIEAELKQALPDLFGAGLTSSEVPKAFGHQTFQIRATDGRVYLLKIARQPPEIARLEALASAIALARSGGVHTPDVVRVAPAATFFGQRPYLLQEYWPGTDAEDAWTSLDTASRSVILADWGREVARMHAVGGTAFNEGTVGSGQEGDWSAHVTNRMARLVQYNQKAQVLEAAVLGEAESRITFGLATCAPDVRPSLTHRDLCLKNVLLSSKGLFTALLDFEHARMSDPVLDFVKLRLWLFERDADAEGAFMRGYREGRPEPWPHESERYEIALLLELLGEIPYYKRSAAKTDLAQAVARLQAALNSRSG